MEGLCVISTKNPNQVLLDTIQNVKTFYPEFDLRGVLRTFGQTFSFEPLVVAFGARSAE